MEYSSMKYYTPEQYILKSLGEYPTLYYNTTYNNVRYAVLDQILNVIGNGIDDLTEFEYQDYDFENARKYITKEPLYYGYHKDDCEYTYFEGVDTPYINSNIYAIPIYVLESECTNHPEIGKWLQTDKKTSRKVPYPNFSPTYSFVYKQKIEDLGEEWINEAIWYYQESLQYFNNPEQYKTYHFAFPHYDKFHDRDNTESLLQEFRKHIKDKYQSYEAISEAYGVTDYNGDDYDFLCRRWQQGRTHIIKFINDTINLLESYL